MSHSHLEASITLILHARRAQIGKYATDNRATKAATLFSKLLDSKISESNASILDFSDKKTLLHVQQPCPLFTVPARIMPYGNINCQK